LYVEFNDGGRLFIGEGGGPLNDDLERLQLVNPSNQNGRVFQFSESEFIVQWPGAGDITINANSLQNISWAPDSPRFVYATPDGQLVVGNAATGEQETIGSSASAPVWSSPVYRVQR
ncbi:MAG: hypothetical protein ACLFTK_15590, partial [Anaerolineales bacterium]